MEVEKLSRVLASSLRDRKILTDKGLRIGKIYDIIINENSGKLETLVIDPESEEIKENLMTDEDDNVLIPFSSVVAVKDYIIISESSLAIQQARKG